MLKGMESGAGAAEPGVCAETPGAVVGEVAVPTTPTPVAGAEGRRAEDAGAHTEGPGAGDDELVAGAEEPGVQAPPAPSVSTKTSDGPWNQGLLTHFLLNSTSYSTKRRRKLMPPWLLWAGLVALQSLQRLQRLSSE